MSDIVPRTSPWLMLASLVLLNGVACGGAATSTPTAGAETGSSGEAVAPDTVPAQAGADSSALTAAAAEFDGERALEHVRALVEIGPRVAGSEAIERTRDYIETQIESYGLTVRRDAFVESTPIGDVELVNLIVDVAPWGTLPGSDAAGGGADVAAGDESPAAEPAVVLAGHYDTKYFEEFEFVGANDAGSSTGLLIEAARSLALHPPGIPVRIVFFDGEEAWVQWSGTDHTYGSRHMAAQLEDDGRLGEIGALVLVDMIGDADLAISKDGNSTKWLTDLIWETARELGYRRHFIGAWTLMEDDHIPFVRAGVDAIDLIDFEYGPQNRYWHAAEDTLDKVSAASIEVVGRTVLAAIPRMADRLAGGPRR